MLIAFSYMRNLSFSFARFLLRFGDAIRVSSYTSKLPAIDDEVFVSDRPFIEPAF